MAVHTAKWRPASLGGPGDVSEVKKPRFGPTCSDQTYRRGFTISAGCRAFGTRRAQEQRQLLQLGFGKRQPCAGPGTRQTGNMPDCLGRRLPPTRAGGNKEPLND